MSFSDELMERNLPTARHEFGHYVVARELGFKTGAVSIMAPLALAGPAGWMTSTLMRPLRSLSEVATYCENRAMVLMAGVLAEALEDGAIDYKRAKGHADTSGSHDAAKWREFLHLLRDITHPSTVDEEEAAAELDDLCERLMKQASAIVLRHQDFINRMASELCAKEAHLLVAPTFTEAELAKHALVRQSFP